MTEPVPLDEIARFAPFATMSEPHRRRLAAISRRATAHEGEQLMAQGQDSGDLYIVLDGEVALSLANGKQFSTVGPGELLGWSVLLRTPRRVASAVATKETHLVAINGSALRRLCEADPKVGYAVMRGALECVALRLSDTRKALVATRDG